MPQYSRTAMVTGASSGIGFALVQRFLKEGYQVIATCHRRQLLEDNLRVTPSDRERLLVMHLDVTQEDQWSSLFATLEEKKIELDILVNNAGILDTSPFSKADLRVVKTILDTNIHGTILGCHQAIRHMSPFNKGHIINICSLAGITPVPSMSAYSASKFAVRGFSISLALELRDQGIQVSCVAPDATITPMLEEVADKPEASVLFSLKKPLYPEDICQCIFNKVIPHQPIEVMIPHTRGLMAKLAGSFPRLAQLVAPLFASLGRKYQLRRLQGQKGS